MDGQEYRARLLQHAIKRGYPAPVVSGNNWIFTVKGSNRSAVVEFEPGLSEKSGYLIYAKGVLTSHSSLAPPSRPRYSPNHPIRRNPSSNKIDEWIFADPPESSCEPNHDDDEYVGKWLIFSKPEQVDLEWAKIRQAVEAGELSIGAKVATYINMSRSNDYYPPKHYVICVYTSDWRDKEDVFRHRLTLKRLGFERELYYKTNEMTRQRRSRSTYRS